MKSLVLVILLIFSLFNIAAEEEKNEEKKEPKTEKPNNIKYYDGVIFSSSKNLKVPKSMVKKIEELIFEDYKKSNPESDKKLFDVLLDIEVSYLQLKLYMDQKNSQGPLFKNMSFALPRGGGIIDFSESISQKRKGSFNLYFRFEDKDVISDSKLKVFYVSTSVKRQADEDIFGAGCGKYYDITKTFRDSYDKGYQLNATDGLHAHVVGGIFAFVLATKEKLKLALVKFTDSNYSYAECKGL